MSMVELIEGGCNSNLVFIMTIYYMLKFAYVW